MYNFCRFEIICDIYDTSAESQKGVNAVQWCSFENQKGAIAIEFVQQ